MKGTESAKKPFRSKVQDRNNKGVTGGGRGSPDEGFVTIFFAKIQQNSIALVTRPDVAERNYVFEDVFGLVVPAASAPCQQAGPVACSSVTVALDLNPDELVHAGVVPLELDGSRI